MKKWNWLLSVLVPLACVACTADSSSEDDGESEPSGSSEDALKSSVSCTEHAATGYKSGSPYAMTVITVGGKSTAKPTAHAYLKMQAAAEKAGVTLSLSSGFRTMAEQQHLYSCYLNKNCNGGNLAAKPGFSNHQNGRALDLATSDWSWLASNASRFGFKRTVPSERWHYEFFGADPGGPCSGASQPAPSKTTPGAPATPADPSDPTDPSEPGTPAADPGGNVPLPPKRPADLPADTTGGCWSPTMNQTMEPGACVQSSADDVVYQCHAGLWYRGVTNNKGPYGTCTSSNVQ